MIENFESEFLAFCKAKPADEFYDADNGDDCALGQFVGSKGYIGWWLGCYSKEPKAPGVKTWDYPEVCWRAALAYKSAFGALVQRLEAAGVASAEYIPPCGNPDCGGECMD